MDPILALNPILLNTPEALAMGFATGAVAEEAELTTLALLEQGLDGAGIEQKDLQLTIAAYIEAIALGKREMAQKLGATIAEEIRRQGLFFDQLLRRRRTTVFESREKIIARARAVLGRDNDTAPQLEYLQRYRYQRQMDAGRDLNVWFAIDQTTGNQVVIKVLKESHSRSQPDRKKFFREIRIMDRLRHPHIVKLIDFGDNIDLAIRGRSEQTPQPFLVMEYAGEKDLQDRLDQGPLTWDEAKPIFIPVTEALHTAHTHGVIHRDLKPEHILLQTDPNGKKNVTVIDFGVAFDQQDPSQREEEEGEGMAWGTPLYMSPEQIGGYPLDSRSDVYGLGVVLFETLTERLPFQSISARDIMIQHLSKPPPLPRKIRPDLNIPQCAEDIILKALAKNPADRFQNMLEVAQAMRACR